MAGLLVHDWIENIGGSENVLLEFHRMFPSADVLTLWNNNPNLLAPATVLESFLARSPLRGRKAAALPLMPAVWRSTPASRPEYEWILVSSHSFAHHVRGNRHALKLVYVHSPARYLWVPELDKRGQVPFLGAASTPLKALDRRRAQEAHAIVANSSYIRDRVRSAWQRDSTVIHPPVRVELIQRTTSWGDMLSGEEAAILDTLPAGFLLGASRFVAYKQLDKVIELGADVDIPVVLAGHGPDRARLEALARSSGAHVTFVDRPSDPLLFALYQRALTFVFPAIEDFGIMPVEAAASGARVVANRIGGAAETVIPGVTGALADFQSPSEVRRALDEALSCDASDAAVEARRFSVDRFRAEFRAWMAAEVATAGGTSA